MSDSGAAARLACDWERVVDEALDRRRDLVLKLADESRPRLVTPHRVSRRGDSVQLEALVHDSGDLRAFAAERIEAAALGDESAPERLPTAANVVPLRAARNDKCPCGSNKKYKRCCLPADVAAGSS